MCDDGEMGPNRVGGADQRRSYNDDYQDAPKSRAGEPAGHARRVVADKPGVPGGDSSVRRGVTPAGSSDDEAPAAINGRPTVIPSNNEQPTFILRSFSEGGTDNVAASFDAGKLHSQLAGLLQLYLARAADAEAVQQCSAKDAISCAKALTSMMTDVQSGRPASVDKHTRLPQIKSWSGGLQAPTPLIARPGDLHAWACRASGSNGSNSGGADLSSAIPRNKSRAGQPACTFGGADKPGGLGGEPHPTESSRYSILEDALAAVLSSGEECSIPEPHMRFIARADRLCKEVCKRLPNSRSGGLQATTPLKISRPGGRASKVKNRRLDSRHHPDDPPVGACPPERARHAVPSNEGDKASVVQPRPGGQAFRAGSSDDKTRAKALDYREKRQSSRAGEPPARQSGYGDGASGLPNEDAASFPLGESRRLKTDDCFT